MTPAGPHPDSPASLRALPPHPMSPRPFSSRRPVALGMLSLVVLLGGTLGWGAFASISGAVIAPGRIELEGRAQAVEHVDGGTVKSVLVRNGDRVAAGDVLVRLDDGELRSDEALLAAEHAELVARRNRLEAEYRDAAAIDWDEGLARRAETDEGVRAILDGQRRLFEARRASLAGQTAQLRERVVQTRRQIASLEAQLEAVRRQAGFVARELTPFRELFEDGGVELPQLMERERAAARLDGEAGDIGARIAGARSRVAEIELQVLQIGANRMAEAEGEAREVQAKENQVRERLAAVRARLARMAVRAPVPGEVFEMRVFAPAEVVRPGEPILKIVPEDAALVVRAELDPIHVDQVWPGQEATFLFPAFAARTTPAFEGRVLRVAADASRDERTGLAWYEVELEMGQALEPDAERSVTAWAARQWAWAGDGAGRQWDRIADWLAGGPGRGVQRQDRGPERLREAQSGRSVAVREEPAPPPEPDAPASGSGTGAGAPALELTPGMPAEVYLRTGERTPLSYLVKPLSDYFSRALREE